MSEKAQKIKVGISIGDLNGIGMEVILKTFKDARMMDFCTPIIFGSNKVGSIHSKAIETTQQCTMLFAEYDNLRGKLCNEESA